MSEISQDLHHLGNKYLKAKKQLREWEQTFQRKHHRPPTVQDIGARPNVEKYYKKYNQLKKDYKRAQDEHNSSSVDLDKSSIDLSLSNSDNNNKQQKQDSKMTEEEAFWLCDRNGKTSLSQPTASKTEERLILGGSQPIPKKNVMLEQKLFGHLMQNPRNNNNNNNKVEVVKAEPVELNTQDIPMMVNDDEDDVDIQIINRELDHFRLYCDGELPSIRPCFFNSSKVTCAIPLVNNESERQRRERILYKLEKGILGEKVEENTRMEGEMDDDVKEFLSQYNNNSKVEDDEEMSSSQPSSPGSSSTSSQHSKYNSKYNKYNPNKPYKKKPIQRRQTRLYKLKFVETR